MSRVRVLLVCGASAAVALAGCGGGGGTTASRGTPASTPTTVTPSAVTSTPVPPPVTTTPARTTPPAPPPKVWTSAELKRTVLTLHEMPAGFRVGQDPEDDQSDPFQSTSKACADAVNALYANKPPARAGVRYIRAFPGGRQFTVMEEEVGSWAGTGSVRFMATIARTPARCPTWHQFAQGYGTVTFTATPVAFPHAGEQVMAYTVVAHWPTRGYTHEIWLFARSDTRVFFLDYFAPVGRVLDRAECDRIVATALGKQPGWRRH